MLPFQHGRYNDTRLVDNALVVILVILSGGTWEYKSSFSFVAEQGRVPQYLE
jgi:hypothetical protein